MKKFIIIFNMILIFIFIFFYAFTKYNIVFCEEVLITIPPDMLDNLKIIIYEKLLQLVSNDIFIEKYGSGPLFNFIYLKNSHYIKDFVENLPLNEIIYSKRYESSQNISEYIIELFCQDVLLHKQQFGKNLIFLANLVFMGKYLVLTSELNIIIDALTTFVTPHPEAIENIPILTEGYLQMSLELIKKKTVIVETLYTMPKAIEFNIIFDNNSYNIVYKYYFNYNGINWVVEMQDLAQNVKIKPFIN